MPAMNREDVLALYRPIRASIQCVLRMAVPVCSRADWTRAAKQLGLWAEGQVLVDDDDQIDMLADVALFEPNQRGRRSFDHFLEKTAQQLAPPDLALAHRMATPRRPDPFTRRRDRVSVLRRCPRMLSVA